MRTIFKYPVKVGENVVEMPLDAEILSAAWQERGEIVVWAKVEVDTIEVRARGVVVVATGGKTPEGPLRFINTVCVGSFLYYHVFELT